ncbi:MAG TPA: glucose-1-phosphate cytidylyltransferase [Mycobacteriales bacterium]|nr:glucose-1-phosphate cytidylyltransferase [Mycobacteriales bacterium]
MKVVLFCGGLGLRMRSGNESAPKPMMTIGDRPVLWHIMRYYAHFGHTEFILCLGYGAQAVKDYFLEYKETASNDFVLSKGGGQVELLGSDISDWKITFVDTGMDTEIGERLRRVRRFLDDDEVFLASYGDVLTDAPMDEIISRVLATDVAGCMLAVKLQASFHVVHLDETADLAPINGFESAAGLPLWINGGFFVLRQSIFDYLNEGDDLVTQGCERAARDGRMLAVPYRGFWAPMDTLKERSYLEELHRSGRSPWELWRIRPGTAEPAAIPMVAEEPMVGVL